ncbi:cyanophycinase [Solitalea sp. MAHUQ-68]|uniref:Cyanophycinase n=1 Tax=Solitalea agri TaxID=2953739 RepID=A0A9X2JBS6_9SPHI|nr:cyanophycinase [Solitalea agri]MCO4292298.1 cyanophycinase [Solitalea agri]
MKLKQYLIVALLFCGHLSCSSSNPEIPVERSYSLGLTGDASDKTTATTGGFVLMGGGADVDEAIKWMIAKSGGGDVVVIRASGGNAYNSYIYGLGNVNSVETLLISSNNAANDPKVATTIRNAEALFIAGGDQSQYLKLWANTPVQQAIDYLVNEKKVPVGGTSAGCAILGQFIYTGENGSIISSEALSNPFLNTMTFSEGRFVNIPLLDNLITDTHYSQRDRQGRHFTMLARLVNEKKTAVKGLGVDENTAACLDTDGTMSVYGSGNAFYLESVNDLPEQCQAAKPLSWNASQKAVAAYIAKGSTTGTSFIKLGAITAQPTEYWFALDGKFTRAVNP